MELGLNHSRKSFRLSEHVYLKKGSDKLCFPKGFNWNSEATVYFILPVKDQGRWVYHFINELTVASLFSGDTNFHVIVADFESQDIDMAKAFNTSLFRSRHTIVNMTGKFYKTLALNEAVARVPSEHDLLFLFDLHIDVPVDIMDSVRKVSDCYLMDLFSTPSVKVDRWKRIGGGGGGEEGLAKLQKSNSNITRPLSIARKIIRYPPALSSIISQPHPYHKTTTT